MTFPKYPEYKDSGIEWLGEVPAHWEKLKLSLISLEKCDGPFGSSIKSEHYRDNGVRVIRLQNIKKYFFNGEDAAYIDAGYYCQQIAKSDVIGGDLLVAGLGDDNNVVGRACVAPCNIAPAMVKADCFRFRLDTKRALPDFLAYQLSAGAEADAGLLSTGSTRSRIPLSTMGTRIVALPPSHEQVEVSAFLDYETARIDALVEEQQRLTELLKEKRQAVISHAVTKGVDTDVPMKDSGVEWLGEVPAHWVALPLKHLVREPLKYGANEAAADNNAGHPRFVRITDVAPDGTLRDETFRSLPPDVAKQYLLEEGDILFARSGATVGKSFIYKRSWGECCFAGYLIRARIDLRKALPEFIYFSFQSHGYWQYIGQQQIQATIQNVSAERYENYVLPTPPVDEQDRIVEHLNQCLGDYSKLLEAAEQSISFLQERRSALISAAVTGKIDVRGWQPPAGSSAPSEAIQTEAV
ncbi:restriction endonuclease subunit S [Halomonas huangheensis]|uniref:Type I restriction modification DNA specificity domain-containing protein n=1 Tax=Halomonas huangheensis TaxID=1178482 RepID=W1N8W6_9GAMM|nr:restriction endonuclease subunit S [Halomonas huangheensis]ALM53388.1 hypothetical protein AR456_14710 [Halomonas huangheensis]ERL51958.1 hypothetical protein BJB45_12385 [Halomonas huangheensis]